MSNDQVVPLITAIGTAITGLITAVGVILIALMRKKVDQVEKQGNSVSLELKRTNMVYARRLATADSSPGNMALADEAEEAYDAALKANEKL